MSRRSRGRRLHVYRRGAIGWFLIGCIVLILLLGIDQLLLDPTIGGKSFGAALAVVSGAYAYVLWRMCNLVLFSRGALVGTALRPRWIRWSQIQEVVLENDHDGYGRAGHAPLIRLKSGRPVKLGAFFAANGSKRDVAVAIVNGFNDVRSLADEA